MKINTNVLYSHCDPNALRVKLMILVITCLYVNCSISWAQANWVIQFKDAGVTGHWEWFRYRAQSKIEHTSEEVVFQTVGTRRDNAMKFYRQNNLFRKYKAGV